MNLKDRLGRVVAVNESSCYSPEADGSIIAALGGFSYFCGWPTDDAATHAPAEGNLMERGELLPLANAEHDRRGGKDQGDGGG